MNRCSSIHLKLCLHGLAVELDTPKSLFSDHVQHILAPFIVDDLPERVTPALGALLPYHEPQVVRAVSAAAHRLPQTDVGIELYRDAERFWLVDERWGICEINLLRAQFRSWILPRPSIPPVRWSEGALLWPLAQLLGPRGLHLLPAISLARDNWGVLIFTPFSLEPELLNLLHAGYHIVAQRWTAIREDSGRIELLSIPGVVDRAGPPRLRHLMRELTSPWIDLTSEFPSQNHTFCDAVVIIEPGRRTMAHCADLSVPEAQETLRLNWPMLEIHFSRRSSLLGLKLAQACRCAHLQLSRNPSDLLATLETLRINTPGHTPQVTVSMPDRKMRIPA